MLRYFFKPVRLFAEALRDEKSPHLLALGVTLGMLVGLVPKDNLTATVLTTVLLVLRLNLGAAAASTVIFMWVGSLVDPLSHRLGEVILGAKPLESVLTRLLDLPLVPWTNLNNTVVLGSLVLGLMFAVPVYVFCRRAVARFGPPVVERLERYKFYQTLRAAEAARAWRVS